MARWSFRYTIYDVYTKTTDNDGTPDAVNYIGRQDPTDTNMKYVMNAYVKYKYRL